MLAVNKRSEPVNYLAVAGIKRFNEEASKSLPLRSSRGASIIGAFFQNPKYRREVKNNRLGQEGDLSW